MKKVIGIFASLVIMIQILIVPTYAAEKDKDNCYIDEEAKVTIYSPTNWINKDVDEGREFIKTKFVNEDGSAEIIYGSVDVWKELPLKYRLFKNRRICDSSLFSKDEIKEMVGIKGASLSTESFNAIEYYKFIGSVSSLSGLVEVDCICHVLINNGYAYMFMYFGDMNHYSSYRQLLVNLEYDDYVASGNNTGSYSNNNGENDYFWLNIVVSLLITVLIYHVPLVIYKYKKKRSALENKAALKIVIIYGIISFIIMNVICILINGNFATNTVAVFFWGTLNYWLMMRDLKVKDKTNGFEEKIERLSDRRNILTESSRPFDSNFGYEETNPILTSTIKYSDKYLSNLRTMDNHSFTWNRRGSICVPEVNGCKNIMVDMYDLYLNGELYKTIYICPYGHNSDNVPLGLKLDGVEPLRLPQNKIIEPLENNKKPEGDNTSCVYCRKCGTKLPTDSMFCTKCGTKIENIT